MDRISGAPCDSAMPASNGTDVLPTRRAGTLALAGPDRRRVGPCVGPTQEPRLAAKRKNSRASWHPSTHNAKAPKENNAPSGNSSECLGRRAVAKLSHVIERSRARFPRNLLFNFPFHIPRNRRCAPDAVRASLAGPDPVPVWSGSQATAGPDHTGAGPGLAMLAPTVRAGELDLVGLQLNTVVEIERRHGVVTTPVVGLRVCMHVRPPPSSRRPCAQVHAKVPVTSHAFPCGKARPHGD